jgi:hypothetical protein
MVARIRRARFTSALHQPPPAIVLIGREAGTRAVVGQAGTQNLHGLGQALVALRRIAHALQQHHPVDDRVRGPLVGRGIDAVEHARRGLARQRQRGNGRQLAHFQILARAPEVALDAAFHKRDQAVLHARTLGGRNHEALVNALRQADRLSRCAVSVSLPRLTDPSWGGK